MTVQRIAAATALSCLLIWTVYRYGMFFEASFYRVELLLCAAGLATVLWLIAGQLGGRSSAVADALRDKWLVIGLPFGLALLYLFHLLLGEPLSVQGSAEQALRFSTYGAYLLLLGCFFQGGSRLGLLVTIHIVCAFVILGSLAGWLGWLPFDEIVFASVDDQLSTTGLRLAGFFQYPNMLGAIAAALLLWCLQHMVMGRLSAGAFLTTAFLAVPSMLVLLLTESRAAWLTAVLIWGAGIVLIASQLRACWLLYSGMTLLLASLFYRIIIPLGQTAHRADSGGEPGFNGTFLLDVTLALLLLFVAALALLGLRYALQVRGSIARFGYALGGTALSGALSYLILPAAAHGRLEAGRFDTGAARLLFYEDALRLWQERPWFGAGGDAWRQQFTRIQQQPYVGSEVHSGYLDMLLELGLVGLVLLGLLLLILLRRVWQSERTGLLPIAVLLLHAAVDFDMSYGFYWLLLFTFSALYAKQEAQALFRRRRAVQRTVPAVAQSLAVLLLAAALLAGWRLELARAAHETARASSGAARIAALGAGLEANPWGTRIRLELAPLVPLGERAALLEAGLQAEPQSMPLAWELGRSYAELGRMQQAAGLMRQALQADRFDKAKQTEAVQLFSRLAQRHREAGRYGEARQAAQTALAFYEAYEALDQEVRQMTRPANGRRFELTAEAAQAAERSRLLLGVEGL